MTSNYVICHTLTNSYYFGIPDGTYQHNGNYALFVTNKISCKYFTTNEEATKQIKAILNRNAIAIDGIYRFYTNILESEFSVIKLASE